MYSMVGELLAWRLEDTFGEKMNVGSSLVGDGRIEIDGLKK